MKRKLLWSLVGIGMLFGQAEGVSARAVADTSATIAADTFGITVPSAAELRIDSLLEILDQRLTGLEQEVHQLDRQPRAHRGYQGTYLRDAYLTAIYIVLFGCLTLVALVFISQRYRYRRRKEQYERDRFAIERGCYSALQEHPRSLFIKRLLILGIVGFCILTWIGIVNLNYLKFFPLLLFWVLLGGVGYAVFRLFRLYAERRDEER